jgi:signal transduction histidine kinase/ActR/RegA family two-component response regulator
LRAFFVRNFSGSDCIRLNIAAFGRPDFFGRRRGKQCAQVWPLFPVLPLKRVCRPPAWIFAVLGGGTILSFALCLTIQRWERREFEKRVADVVHEQVEKLQVTILRSMEVLHSIASLREADGSLRRDQFRQFVQTALSRQPELQALSWNPRVPESERAWFEAAAVADGLDGFQFREKNSANELQPAAHRAEYVPVYFIEPLDRNALALGYDLGSDSKRRVSLEQARDTGKAVATAPIRLAQDPANQAGLLVLLPVYSGPAKSVEEYRAKLAGFAVAVFRVNDLVGGALRELHDKGVDAKLFDGTRDGELICANSASPGQPSAAVRFEVAGRNWVLGYDPTPDFAATVSRAHSRLVLSCGLIFTLLTTVYLYGGWRRTIEIAAANRALEEEIVVRQRAEAAAADANRAKSDFLASMSHEIRTPLNAILGYAQLMRRDPGFSPEQHDAIAGISASGRHLLGVINEVLDLSKIEAGRMELNESDFNLIELGQGLAATFRPMCAEKRIAFRVEADCGEGKRVRGDDGKLRQVLINLLGNAVKFTAAGEVCLRFRPDAGRWLFEVIDTGQGIPDEEQQDIFEPFHQGSGARNHGGTGLGLAIAQRQVELLGGKLELQSDRGFGSRFSFAIPLAAALQNSDAAEMQISRLAPGHSVLALVVDDRKENRDVLGGMLSAVGCEVLYASKAGEALSRAREQKPAIIFLDLLLPGIDGLELARALLENSWCGPAKIVMHTASALAQRRAEALAVGCVDFLAKPFQCERVHQCLKDHLHVEFEMSPGPREPAPIPASDFAGMVLPEELSARMMVAAELHSTTALKLCLPELRRLGPHEEQLADQIRLLMRSYDMDGIMRLLSGLAGSRTGSLL